MSHGKNFSEPIIGMRKKRLAAVLAALIWQPAFAATLTVDTNDGGSASHACSLRDAVSAINLQIIVPGSTCGRGDGNDDTIRFAPGIELITFTASNGNYSALNVNRAMTIDGNAPPGSGRPAVTLARANQPGVFFRVINATAPLVLRGIAVQGGAARSPGLGGGIRAIDLTLYDSAVNDSATYGVDDGVTSGGGIYASSVRLFNSTVSGNLAKSGGSNVEGKGGGIAANNVYLKQSVVSGNTAYGGDPEEYDYDYPASKGGGIFAGTLTTIRSTISGNTLSGASVATNYSTGAGVYATTATFIDSTVSGNIGVNARDGAGIAAVSLDLFFSTVTDNHTLPAGKGTGAILVGSEYAGGSATITGSLIFGNETADVTSYFHSTATGDHNIVGRSTGMVSMPGDTRSCDPKLGPLDSNGGQTRTHGLLKGSCAIDAGPISTDPGGGFPPLTTDQRDNGYSRKVGAAPDIGAFEKQGDNDPDVIFDDGFDP
ncbi:MAG TPA: choice-of-anchor Q domain-containing protein [Rudaea sp.]|nr:choice-of-anchor Q domain-containing protein [Rudaea sp.]